MNTYSRKVVLIQDLLPPNIGKGTSICLLKDVNAVKKKLNELRLTDSEKEAQQWILEREQELKGRNSVCELPLTAN